VTENEETRKTARRRWIVEALVLFIFAWIATVTASLVSPGARDSFATVGLARFLGTTFSTGLEIFVFGYVLSRFFKQFKTGCAFVIILFFAYLIWAGRQPQ
jgi:galactitol-specific phosphotransferase system IIC component